MAPIEHGRQALKSPREGRRRATRASRFSYAELVGLQPRTFSEVREAVEGGFAFATLEHFRRATNLTLREIAELIGVPERTLLRRRESGRLGRQESDRLLRAARVVGRAIDLFEGDEEAARAWLWVPQAALGGVTPLAAAATEIGAREVENLIGRIEHGIPS